ncbi:hypothetical protein AARAC_011039 [Aspergillus arachidicola]|uniref:Fucose-specific lectin n=1 Tax=Aspergillus arachidicola TaxID=656916 RepID=A0A2G7G918_9EURO|nr:hypothetical protein AARAC_011039 [Aspergillus arachidicola]
MDLNAEDLIDALRAKAYAFPPDESGMYLVSYDDDALCEEHRVKSENINQRFISMDVPESSPAAYLCDENIRWLYCLDENHSLIRYKYDFAEASWDQVPIPDRAPVAVHVSSHIGGCVESSNCHDIFFQNPSGQLQGVTSAGETSFQPLLPIPFPSKPGSPIYAAYRNNVLYVWYLDPGNHMHCLTRTAKDADWQDTEVSGAAFGDTEITNFMSLFDESDLIQIIVVSANGMVFMVNPYGKLAHLGTVTNGQYKPVSGAENIYQLAAKIHGTFKPKTK